MTKTQNTINSNSSLSQALEHLSKAEVKCLLVVDHNQNLVGTLTDGDIRRSLVKSNHLNNKVNEICNKKFFFIKRDLSKSKLNEIFLKKQISLVPLIKNKKIVRVHYIDKFLDNKKIHISNNIQKNSEIVIMAGGRGQRLSPFSELLPKPLIPINGKPVIDHIIEKFLSIGIKKIHITVNYKKNIIKSYLKDQFKKLKIVYIEEKKPLGTASSINFIKIKKPKNLLVINCDTILNLNFDKLLDYHINQKNDFTIVSAFKKIVIPYGVCHINKNQRLLKVTEKPSTNNLIVVGAYCFKGKLIKYIPKNKNFNMNDFIKKLIKKKYKVGIYPISEIDWQDVGEWPEYFKTVSNFQK